MCAINIPETKRYTDERERRGGNCFSFEVKFMGLCVCFFPIILNNETFACHRYVSTVQTGRRHVRLDGGDERVLPLCGRSVLSGV